MKQKYKSQDEYYTRREQVEALLIYLKPNSVIWCPADIELISNFAKVFREAGHKVICTHIWEEQDFLTYEPDFEFDYIITNPPYSIRKQWLEKTISYNKPYALLMPIISIMLKDFKRILMTEDIELLMFLRRVRYITTEQKNQPTETGYFCKGIIGNNIVVVDNES